MLGDDEEIPGRNAPDRPPVAPPRGALVAHERMPGYGAYEWFEEDAQESARFDLQRYVRILAKHWLIIVAAMVLALAGGIAKTLLATKLYTSAAVIQIDREPVRVGSLEAVQPAQVGNADEFFQTQYNLLRSQALAERTVDLKGLDGDSRVLAVLGLNSKDGRARPSTYRAAIAGYIRNSIRVAPMGRSRHVRIEMETPDPNVSATLANAVAESFVSWTLDRRMADSDYARDYLQQKLAESEAELKNLQRQLAQYATAQQIISIAGRTDSSGQTGASQTLVGSSLLSINERLDQARAERIRAQQRLEQAQAAGANAPEVLQNPTIQSLQEQLNKSRSEYQDKAIVYLPNEESMRRHADSIAVMERSLNQQVNGVLQSLRATYEAALAEERELENAVRGLRGEYFDQNARSIEYEILQRDVQTASEKYDSLLEELNSVSVVRDIANNNLSIVDRAVPNAAPSSPNPVRDIGTALVLGLVLGIGLAFLIEYFDESIKSPEDVEKKLGLPLIGSVPKLPRNMTPKEALQDIRSSFSEAYYSVRTALQFSTDHGVPSSLLVTSARPSEGKSTSAMAIAQNFARLGLRVLLIDGDLRNPSLHRAMEVEQNVGLSNFLTGALPLSRVVQATPTPGLSFVPCGPLPPNPAELLAGSQVKVLLKEAANYFDIVVIDGPPIMGLADAPILAASAAGTLLVVEAGGTGRNLLRGAMRRLNVGAPRILGVLLTKFDARKASYGYGYGYGYSYEYEYGSKPQLKHEGP